jgi:hypothetical protein
MSVFGFGNMLRGDYAAKSLIPDFAENIRCGGYVLEIEKKLEEISPEFAKTVYAFTDIFTNISEYIKGIL